MYMPHCMPDYVLNGMPHDMLLCYGYTAHYARSEITVTALPRCARY